MVHIYKVTIQEALKNKTPECSNKGGLILKQLELANIPNLLLDAAMDGFEGIVLYKENEFGPLSKDEKEVCYTEVRKQLKEVDLESFIVPKNTWDLRIVSSLDRYVKCKEIDMIEASIPNPYVQRGIIIPF